MKNVTVSLDSILDSLRFLSSSNKRWLADHLIEQVAREEEAVSEAKATDDDFFKEFMALPHDYPITAEEQKKLIRESRHFGARHFKSLSNIPEQ